MRSGQSCPSQAAWLSRSLLGLGSALLLSTLPAAAQCVPTWTEGYVLPGIAGTVYCSTVFDDGSGPHLYVGGNFVYAGGVRAGCVARWSGSEWEQVGDTFFANPNPSGVLGTVRCLAVYDGQLYAGGQFRRVGTTTVNNIAAWDGASWSALTMDVTGVTSTLAPPSVNALTVFDDGTGAKLYLGGHFTDAGGLEGIGSFSVNSIATWDGVAFGYVGDAPTNGLHAGFPPQVDALGAYQGRLFIAGGFQAGGTATNSTSIVTWSGAGWQSVGSLDTSSAIRTFTVFDEDGSGPAAPILAAGGTLTTVGIGFNGSPGVSVRAVARFDGSAWSSFGPGLPRDPEGLNSTDITCLTVHNTGGGDVLFAAGYPQFDANGPVNSMWTWNQGTWQAAPDGPARRSSAWGGGRIEAGGVISTLLSADLDGAGPATPVLFAGGAFDGFGSTVALNIAAFADGAWTPLHAGNPFYTSGASSINWSGPAVSFIIGDEDGPGPRNDSLYAYGNFVTAGGVMAPASIVRRDGSNWTPLGSGPGAPSAAAVFHDDGAGTRLYTLRSYGYLDRWDGATWTNVASIEFEGGTVRAATSFDVDGAGPEPASIYIAGALFGSNGPSGIGRWTGAAWVAVTSADVPGAVNPLNSTYTLRPFQGLLYAGGTFQTLDQSTTYNNALARWDGVSWQIVGEANNLIRALAVFQGALHVGGDFTTIGGVTNPGIARFDGAEWSSVGSGVTGSFPTARSQVHSLGVADDGTGTALFLGGPFLTASGVPGTRGVARWDGSAFTPLENGIALTNAIASPPISIGTNATSIAGLNGRVFFAGGFNRAGGTASWGVAEWGCDAPVCLADFNHDAVLNSQDFFDFIAAFFLNDPSADFNADTVINSQDFFDYVAAFFTGC